MVNFCYKCDNEFFGMKGCKGSCTFSNMRNNPLECEEEKCKDGYIEISKGICEPCDSVNDGCKYCHYDTKYPIGYHGFKKRRRFICNECDNGYLISDDGLIKIRNYDYKINTNENKKRKNVSVIISE